MKVTETYASSINENSIRLDGRFHASEGMKSLDELKKKSGKRKKLDRIGSLCIPNGIFIGGRSRRVYVKDASRGIPFLSSSDMLMASFEGANLVSKTIQADLENLILKKSWVLISRSGTIGNMAYVREDMDGLAGSEHIMRVVADESKILPGYLFAFLCSLMGQSLIKLGTFGSVIDTISPEFIANLPVPRTDSTSERKIHELIERASDLRSQANALLEKVKTDIEQHVGFDTPKHSFDHSFSVGKAKIDSNFGMRLDAFGYIGYVEDALKVLKKYPNVLRAQDVGYEFFNPPIFKRMFADSGYPYMSAVNFYNLHPRPERYLSRYQPDVEKYIIRKGMVIVQNAGQRYGLITKPLLVTETLDGVAVTSDVVRISHIDPIENGYICGLLSTNFGRRLALRYSYGTSIPRLDVPKFSLIKIPYPEDKFRKRIGKAVVEAYEKREQANVLEDQAQDILAKALQT